MALTKRVMVLFDPEQYRKLEEEASRRSCSVGSLIRQAVDKEISKEAGSKEQRMQAARRLVSAEEEMPEWQEIEKLIVQGHLE